MGTYWIKWYCELLDDPKMATLPDRIWRRFSELCLIAGKLSKGSGIIPDIQQLAWILRMEVSSLQPDMDELERIGLVQFLPASRTYLIVKFSQRQDAASSTERVSAFRKGVQRNHYAGETGLKQNVSPTDTVFPEADPPASPNPAALTRETYAERIYRLSTGQATFPAASASACIDAILAIAKGYTSEDAVVTYLKSWYGWWIAQRSAQGRPYSRTNTTWLTEKAIACQPPPTVEAPQPSLSKEQRRAQMAAQLEAN